MNQYLWVLVGTGITFAATALGAAMVFLVRKVNEKFQKACLGFASGIMVAAAIWSLLLPSIEMAEGGRLPSYLPAAIGFVAGGLFLFMLDKLIPHVHAGEDKAEGLPRKDMHRSTMLFTSVTLHNIPEGMAVGLAFSLAAKGGSAMTLAGAFVLTFGMALQNFPEGAAISLPLRQEGLPRWKAFLFGAASGAAEPIGGLIIVLLAGALTPVLPYLLAFAAGAMIYVVVEELIPGSHSGGHSNIGVLAFMAGFVIMMLLDVALG